MILIIGAGAIGCSLGYYLQAAGTDIGFWVRSERAEQYKTADTLVLTSTCDQHHAALPRPDIYTQFDQLHTFPDVVLISVKHQQLTEIYPLLDALPDHTVLAPCLNGMQAIQTLQARYPQRTIAPITVNYNVRLCSMLNVRVTTTPQIYLYPKLYDSSFGQACQQSELQTLLGGPATSWGKLLINLNNPIGALTNSTFKDIFVQPDVRQLYLSLLDEAVQVLREQNIHFRMPSPVPYGLQRWMMQHLPKMAWRIAKRRNGLTDEAYPSMHADLLAGNRTEIDIINGEIVRLAEKANRSAPLNKAIVAYVKTAATQTNYQPIPAKKLLDALEQYAEEQQA